MKNLKTLNEHIFEDVKNAAFNLDKIFGDDEESIKTFQDIEDNGTVEDMIHYIEEYGDEEMLHRYGIRSSGAVKNLAKHIMKESINEMKFSEDDYAGDIWKEYQNDILALVKKINSGFFDGNTEEIITRSLARIYQQLSAPGMQKKYQKQLGESVNEAWIGPFVFNDKMSDDELKAMYDGALDGYSYHTKGMQYPKSDYKQAYQAIEKILKKRGVKVDESVNEAMAFKKAYKLTKKLNDDALLKDLLYAANKIHDKMGTSDEVNDWLTQVITYGDKHPQMWKEPK